MTVQIELRITHGSEPKNLKEVLFTDESWNDNPFLHQQDVSAMLEHFVEVYGEMMKVNGYRQVSEDRK